MENPINTHIKETIDKMVFSLEIERLHSLIIPHLNMDKDLHRDILNHMQFVQRGLNDEKITLNTEGIAKSIADLLIYPLDLLRETITTIENYFEEYHGNSITEYLSSTETNWESANGLINNALQEVSGCIEYLVKLEHLLEEEDYNNLLQEFNDAEEELHAEGEIIDGQKAKLKSIREKVEEVDSDLSDISNYQEVRKNW